MKGIDNMVETEKEIEQILKKASETEMTEKNVKELSKKFNLLYSKAIKLEEKNRVWKIGKEQAYPIAQEQNLDMNLQAELLFTPLYGRYYNLMKRIEAKVDLPSEEEIGEFMELVSGFFHSMDRKEGLELYLRYGDLLGNALEKILNDPKQGKKINDAVQEEIGKTTDVALILRSINRNILNAIELGEYDRAIQMKRDAEPEYMNRGRNVSRDSLFMAHIINNGGGLARIKQADVKLDKSKRTTLIKAILNFEEARTFYEKVFPPNLIHFDGLKNRLVRVAYRLLLIEGDEVGRYGVAAKEILEKEAKESFEKEKNREKAIQEIIKASRVREVYGIEKILEEIKIIDEFLAAHKEDQKQET